MIFCASLLMDVVILVFVQIPRILDEVKLFFLCKIVETPFIDKKLNPEVNSFFVST